MIDFRKFMDFGLVIWTQEDETVVVQKIKTYKSNTDVLHNDICSNCSIKSFSTYDNAIKYCQSYVDQGDSKLRKCTVQLVYRNGSNFKLKTLENVEAKSYKEALDLANKQVMDFFKKEEIVDKVGSNFELKVRPV